MTLKYYGRKNGSLKEGTYVNVPTIWATGLDKCVTTDAIQEIMEALEEKWITVDDYDSVFYSISDRDFGGLLRGDCFHSGYRAGRMLMYWRKV